MKHPPYARQVRKRLHESYVFDLPGCLLVALGPQCWQHARWWDFDPNDYYAPMQGIPPYGNPAYVVVPPDAAPEDYLWDIASKFLLGVLYGPHELADRTAVLMIRAGIPRCVHVDSWYWYERAAT